jgi:RNA polymerase sigma factor (sigma-70 family)
MYKGHIDIKYSEDEIVEAINNNDEKIIYYLTQKLLPVANYHRGYCTCSDEDVKDNYQETWKRVIINVKLNKYKKKGKFVGYFIRVNRNIWLKFRFNKIKNKIWQESTSSELNNSQDYQSVDNDRNELDIYVNKCIGNLCDNCQKILEMRYIDEMSYEKIGNNLNIKENNARHRMFGCMVKLRNCIKNLINQ